MPGGKGFCGLAVCCVIACTGCRSLQDDSRAVSLNHRAPAAEQFAVDDADTSSPKVRELVSIAHEHHRNGEATIAAEVLLEALQLEPENQRVRTILAITLALEGHIRAAELQFIAALGMAEAHYNLGVILFEQGRIKDAEQRFLRAVQHDPQLNDARVWLDTARRELAIQTAAWQYDINPLPVAPRPATAEEAVVALPGPLSIIQASATGEQDVESLPTIEPIQALPTSTGPATEEPSADFDDEPEPPPVAPTPPHNISVDERAELRTLREEVQRLRIEHQILKKAIGVIAADELGSE